MNTLERIEDRLIRLESLVSNSNNWMDVKTACKYTGLSHSTLRLAVLKGRLRCSKQTGKLLFKRSWLDKYLMFGKQRLTPAERRIFENEC